MYRSPATINVRVVLLCSSLLTAVALSPSARAQASGQMIKRERNEAALLQKIPVTSFVVSSVTARSPVEVQIIWTDTGSAPGYDVLRNGVVVKAVGTPERGYVDGALRPNTKYTYQVRTRTSAPEPPVQLNPGVIPGGAGAGVGPPGAPGGGQFVRPTQPQFTPVSGQPAAEPTRLTAAVEVVTPRALPPSSVSVSLRPDGATRISWTPRPETSSYIVTRNGAPISIPNGPPIIVTSSANAGTYDDRVPGGTYAYSVQTRLRTSDGVDVLGEPSPPLTLLTRSFNVIAIGDSVMWGQGLKDSSKFVTQVRQRLQTQLGKNVQLLLFARSGAELGLNPYPTQFALAAEAAAVQELAASYGEIPRTLPSIMHQALTVAPGRITAADVDLVLMDGCINDVGVATILNPTTAEADIQTKTQTFCGPPTMDARLARVHQLFPNAKILLTGYFPIVSDQSDLTAVAVLMSNVGALSAAVAPLVGVPLDPVTGAIAGVVTSQALRDKAVSHSTVFHATSNSALMTSAVGSNQRLGGNRIRFVPIPFTSQNAYAAPDTWLWLVPTPGVPLSNAVDEVFDQRVRACQSVPNSPATCIPASMGHPNVKGAMAYADAITNTLAEFVPAWKTQHALSKSL